MCRLQLSGDRSSSATSTQLSSSLPTTGVTLPNAPLTLALGEHQTGDGVTEEKEKQMSFFG